MIFVHINKTGGSSIETALGLPHAHKTAFEILKEIGPLWKGQFSFAFVRNPWGKVVSHFCYRVATNQTELRTKPITFAEWVKRAYGCRDSFYYDKPKMFMPQMNWITDLQGKILVDFVGRFEKLEQDFQHVCKCLRRKATLPHLKQSFHENYRQYYDGETKKIITKWFEKDIEQFGYDF